MDGFHFDALTRSLATTGSRRRALALALSGTLASLLAREDTAAHDALLTCKKLKGDKKKKCLKRAKRHMKTHALPASPSCTRNCAGKACGPDGCGGSCGECTGFQQCSASGVCRCRDDQVLCRGFCIGPCSGDRILDTFHCGCCQPNGTGDFSNEFSCNCCSGKCAFAGSDEFGNEQYDCVGRGTTEGCDFNAQCASNKCVLTFCPPEGCEHSGTCGN